MFTGYENRRIGGIAPVLVALMTNLILNLTEARSLPLRVAVT